ncbi:hypothetical protein [Streptomyces sp. NPDC001070]
MQQYALAPYGENESYEQEAEFGAEVQPAGEAGFPAYETGYEAEFGNEAEWGAAPRRGHPYAEAGPVSLESPLSEAEEVQLATELLEVGDEAEMEQFLGNLLRSAARGVGSFLKSDVGKALGGIVKNVAKRALPTIGSALGSFVAPGIGTAVGGKLGAMASNLFEIQTEGLDREQQEFETARQLVRLAATAASNAAIDKTPAAPVAVAGDATRRAAERYAPNLARNFAAFAQPAPWYWPAPVPGAAPARGRRAQSGRWERQGRKIVLYGI